jgi:hypothetical protein
VQQLLRPPAWLVRWIAAAAVAAVVALAGCASPGSAPTSDDDAAPPTSHGVTLLAPEPPAAGLPPAWLIVGDQAIAAAVPAFRWGGVHADPPPALPDLATARLRAGQRAVLVVAAYPVQSVQATGRPWSTDGRITPLVERSARARAVAVRRDGQLTAVAVPFIRDAADQLVQAEVRFGDGEAFSLWRVAW